MNGYATGYAYSQLGCPVQLNGLGFVPNAEQWAALKHFYIDQLFTSPKTTYVYKRIRGKENGDSPVRVIDAGAKFKVLELSTGPNFYAYVSGGGWVPLEVNVWKRVDPNNPGFVESAEQFIQRAATIAKNTGENLLKTAENLVSGAQRTTKAISWLVPTVLVLGVGGLLYYGYKNYLKGDRKLKVYGAEI
jgi:hypothetical protein